ncbi:MAG TPA: FAD-dependent oxidoreductase [Alphaproteobacteria bacterium]|nr:FAD-dependent oxidoreductase [Alphaproteobacteria bacterium]
MQDYSPSHPCRLSQVPRRDFECDVIVVGFGAAGACAAIEAAAAGARVTLFERASGSGGTTALSGADIYMGGNGGTPVQRHAGFSDSTEDMIRYLAMAGGAAPDTDKIRLYAESSLGHFEWLKAQGVPYKLSYLPGKRIEPETDDCLIWSGSEEAWPFADSAKPCPRGHLPQNMGRSNGRFLMDILTRRVESLGVDIRYDSRALALIADEENRVHGIVVRIDNQPRFAHARRGVILCMGGFAMNREMIARHAPRLLRTNDPIGNPGDDGTGIRLGMSVGAAAIHMDEGFCTLPFCPPETHAKGILINQACQRFINEDCYHGRIGSEALKQIGDRIYLLADNEIFQRPLEYSRIEIAAVGESWEEVERELALPGGALTTPVATYNRHAARGEDPFFHKQAKYLKPLDAPPFAALDCSIGKAFYAYFTLGGLDTLPTGEVLTEDRRIIPGLFAAGRTVCGLPRWGSGYSSGMSVGDSSFFGRQAGKQAARPAVEPR